MNSKNNGLSDIAIRLFQSGQYNCALQEHLVKVEEDFLSWYDTEVGEHFMDGVEGDYDWRRRLGKIDADEMVFTYHYEFVRSNTNDVVHHWESVPLKLRGEFVGSEAAKHGCHHCRHLPCHFKRFKLEYGHKNLFDQCLSSGCCRFFPHFSLILSLRLWMSTSCDNYTTTLL